MEFLFQTQEIQNDNKIQSADVSYTPLWDLKWKWVHMLARLKFRSLTSSCKGIRRTEWLYRTMIDCLHYFHACKRPQWVSAYHGFLARRFLSWRSQVLHWSVFDFGSSLHRWTSGYPPLPSVPSLLKWYLSPWWDRRRCSLWSGRHWWQYSSRSKSWNWCWSFWTSAGTSWDLLLLLLLFYQNKSFPEVR